MVIGYARYHPEISYNFTSWPLSHSVSLLSMEISCPAHTGKQSADAAEEAVRMWEPYIHDCKWSQKRYIDVTQKMAKQILLGHA